MECNFEVGDTVLCVRFLDLSGAPGEKHPVVGETYTVRALVKGLGSSGTLQIGVMLVELVNAPASYLVADGTIGFVERAWWWGCFRKVVPRAASDEMFRSLTAPDVLKAAPWRRREKVSA